MSLLSTLPGISDLSTIAGSLANPYGSTKQPTWNLAPATFTTESGVSTTFYYLPGFVQTDASQGTQADALQRTGLDTVTDGGGRRLALYEYPYRDGQEAVDMGRKPERYTFNIKFYGPNYQVLFNRFLNDVVDSGEVGTLTHPTRGSVQASFDSYEITHRHDEWNAVTIRATFVENNFNAEALANETVPSPDDKLRDALQSIVTVQTQIQTTLLAAQAAGTIPSLIYNNLLQRVRSVTGTVGGLLANFAATYATSAQVKQLIFGVITAQSFSHASVTPVFQVGASSQAQASNQLVLSQNVQSYQISTNQAIQATNEARQEIAAAISELTAQMGNAAYSSIVAYKSIAVVLASTLQACLATVNQTVKTYTVPYPMSLRMVAYLNRLTPYDQDAIGLLNPDISSFNYIPKGTVLTVPA